jgi:anaerobic ribonucleoside-triphosphate reductase activating protein
MNLRIHQFLPFSRANGPGLRAVLWVQGCSLGCPGCFNPTTHFQDGGETVCVTDLFERISALRSRIEGITVSGGEPLQQSLALAELLCRIKAETALSVILFTGFRWQEVESSEALRHVDVLIAGRYDHHRRIAHGLRGSTNKTLHFLTNRYAPDDFEPVPPAEVILTPEGEVIMSGIDPLKW